MADEIAEDPIRMIGSIAASETPLVAYLSKRACVYWDVRDGLNEKPREIGKQNFWLETESGRVLVISDHVVVDARAQREQHLLAVAEADIAALSARLRELKTLRREQQGTRGAALDRERKHLAQVATLLHATRAHARGKIHLGGSLTAQADWITEHAAAVKSGLGAATATLALNSWEVALEVGARVRVEGTLTREPVDGDLGLGDGYRSRPTAQVLRGTEDQPLRITGLGSIAKTAEIEATPRIVPIRPRPRVIPKPTLWMIFVIAILGLAAIILITR